MERIFSYKNYRAFTVNLERTMYWENLPSRAELSIFLLDICLFTEIVSVSASYSYKKFNILKISLTRM